MMKSSSFPLLKRAGHADRSPRKTELEDPRQKKPRQGGPPAPEYFSLDLVHLLLLYLPVKTLSRFRCVCKSWSSLISSHLFQREYELRCSKLPPSLLLLQKGNIDKDAGTITLNLSTYNSKETAPQNNFSISILYTSPYFFSHYIQSCRELVCLSSHEHIHLLNPSTQDLVAVPLPAMLTDQNGVHSQCYGLGYAASSRQFKVVSFFVDNVWGDLLASRVTHCEIFTVGTGIWRKAKKPPLQFSPFCVPFLHGALHLLPWADEAEGDDKYIAALDMETEEYKRIPLPEYYGEPAREDGLQYYRLTELGGLLCLTLDFMERVDLWMLHDYDNGEWTKRYSIDTTQLVDFSSTGLYTKVITALVIMDDGNILMNLSLPDEIVLVCYDPERNIITQKIDNNCSATLYRESFFSFDNVGNSC